MRVCAPATSLAHLLSPRAVTQSVRDASSKILRRHGYPGKAIGWQTINIICIRVTHHVFLTVMFRLDTSAVVALRLIVLAVISLEFTSGYLKMLRSTFSNSHVKLCHMIRGTLFNLYFTDRTRAFSRPYVRFISRCVSLTLFRFCYSSLPLPAGVHRERSL